MKRDIAAEKKCMKVFCLRLTEACTKALERGGRVDFEVKYGITRGFPPLRPPMISHNGTATFTVKIDGGAVDGDDSWNTSTAGA